MTILRALLAAAFVLLAGALRADVPITNLAIANQAMEEGHLAFERGAFADAARIYARVANSGYATAAVWTNAGTAAFRAGKPGEAVLYYRRALKMDPGYDNALRSLEVVSPATNEKKDDVVGGMLGRVFSSTTPTFWVVLTELAFLIACVAIARAMSARDPETRGHWGAILGWTAALAIGFGFTAYANHTFRSAGNEAVVMKDNAVTRAEPVEAAPPQLQLPAGTLVEITEEPRKGFVRVKLVDGRSGYLPVGEVERI